MSFYIRVQRMSFTNVVTKHSTKTSVFIQSGFFIDNTQVFNLKLAKASFHYGTDLCIEKNTFFLAHCVPWLFFVFPNIVWMNKANPLQWKT